MNQMKSKMLTFIIIIAVMLAIFIIPAFAEVQVVDITRPEGDEVVTKETFSIFGTCIYDETTIKFEYRDTDGDYKPLRTTDGTSTFKVGSGKMFGKDIRLKEKGENYIRITAYTNTKESKDDPQILEYTITLGDDKNNGDWFEDAINWIKNGTNDESSEKKD